VSRQDNGGRAPQAEFLRGAPDWRVPAATALAACLLYWPFLTLPPLVDDYGHVRLAEIYGAPEGWKELFADPLYRCRATSLWLTAATVKLAGFSIPAFHASGLLLHILNSWLVYALGACRWIGWRASAVAAFVFAANERPHEAVIWYASVHELLVFAFVCLALLGWIRWLEGGGGKWLGAVAGCWLLALLSKESAVVLALLLPAAALLYPERRKAAAVTFLAGAVSGAVYFWLAWSGQARHQHFHDGTFHLGPHFAPVLLNSAARGLGVWGWLAAGSLWVLRRGARRPLAEFAALWFAGALLPYAFLTYMPRIPSRHHYLASAGMALLAASAAVAALARSKRPRLAGGLLAAAFLLHNGLYLWTYKRAQFGQRAEVTEALLRMVAARPGEPVLLRCPLLTAYEARMAVHYRLGLDISLIREEPEPGRELRVYSCPQAR
jgi:hypothetical protein